MITFISGSMFSGKSKLMIDFIDEVEKNYEGYLIYKPTIDTRDGLYIKSRDYDKKYEALPWDSQNSDCRRNFYEKVYRCYHNKIPTTVFLDEVHFLTEEDIRFIIYSCTSLNINTVFSGLETDYKLKSFPVSNYLKSVCDTYVFLTGECYSCGKKSAIYNIRFDKNRNIIKEGDSIVVGDSESYDVICYDCLSKKGTH